MKVAIYSVITNNYDSPKRVVIPRIPHYLFTDDPNIHAPGWEVVEIPKAEDCRLQRKIKILGHPVLDKYDVTVYVDSNIQMRNTVGSLISSYRGGLMIGKHMKRNCVYQEAEAVKVAQKAPNEVVDAQIAEYQKANYPKNKGMWSSGFMIRDASCMEMCKLWHEKLEQHSHRDQLSLPWALWKSPVKVIPVFLHRYMVVGKHLAIEPVRVHYISPFRSDKNIGKANNDTISLLPANDWVCLTDADAMPMLPDYGKQVEDIIKTHGHEFGLIGCMTNRLGGLHQCYDGKFSEDMDVRNHLEIAKELREKHGTLVEETTGVAGLCMIFSVDTWKRCGGWKENDIKADTEFNKSIKRLGMKVGLAKGLYLFHCYRLEKVSHKEAWAHTSHLT